jgi:hypothetical protein
MAIHHGRAGGMSVCRFFWYGSDVYLYYSVRGLECCGCKLANDFGDTPIFPDPENDQDDCSMVLAHLSDHVKAGHIVRPYVFEEFGGVHPDPGPAEEAAEKWKAEHPEYSWMWTQPPETP